MAAGHPALAWPDRWAESWAAVGAMVEALVWWVGTSQAVICPPTGESQRFFTLLPVEGAANRGGV